MGQEQIVNRLRKVLLSFHIPIERMTEHANVRDDLGFDSFGLLELITAVEREFDIQLEDDCLVNVRTVGQMADLLSQVVTA